MLIKYCLIILLSFMMLTSVTEAQSKTAENTVIASLITQVKKASPSQRRVLMNRLKIQLRTMSQKNRKKVMMDLRNTFNSHHKITSMKEMQSNMMQQCDVMTKSAQGMTDAMNRASVSHTGMSGGGMPRGMQPKYLQRTGK